MKDLLPNDLLQAVLYTGGILYAVILLFCLRGTQSLTTRFDSRRSVVRERFELMLDDTPKRPGKACILLVLVLCLAA